MVAAWKPCAAKARSAASRMRSRRSASSACLTEDREAKDDRSSRRERAFTENERSFSLNGHSGQIAADRRRRLRLQRDRQPGQIGGRVCVIGRARLSAPAGSPAPPYQQRCLCDQATEPAFHLQAVTHVQREKGHRTEMVKKCQVSSVTCHVPQA